MKKRNFLCFLAVFLLSLLAPSLSFSFDNTSDNIVILFDDSGSMYDQLEKSTRKFEAAKIALVEVLKDVPVTTNVGLITFHSGWLYDLGPVDLPRLTNIINSITPNSFGGTPLSKFIKIAADRLLEQRAKQLNYGSYRLLVATDGDSTDGEDYKVFAQDIMARGITLDVIGVGMATAHDLSTSVHNYYNANNPASLKSAVRKVFAEIGGGSATISDEEAFEILAALPDGFVEEMIKALSNTGNHPIGTKPKVKEKENTSPTAKVSSAAQNGAQAQGQTNGGDDGFLLLSLLVVAALVFLFFIALIKRG